MTTWFLISTIWLYFWGAFTRQKLRINNPDAPPGLIEKVVVAVVMFPFVPVLVASGLCNVILESNVSTMRKIMESKQCLVHQSREKTL